MNREKILNFFIICMFAALIFSLFGLSVLSAKKYKKLSDSNCIRLIPQYGCRGNILDRQGELIVGNRISYDVMVLAQERSRLDVILNQVGRILEVDPQQLKKNFKNGYMFPSVPVVVATNIGYKKAVILGEYKTDEPGVIIRAKPDRYYPYAGLASHVIGYVNEIDRWRLTKLEDYGYKTKDIVGFGGVEEKYDYYLRQEEGGLSVEVNHQGKFVRVLGFESPRNGKDITLTLDLRVQKIVEGALSGRKGSVVIMDPNSAEIVAMASSPNFNPAVFVKRSNLSIASLFNNPESPLVNRAISSSYAPASLFKIVVASAALELKKINLGTSYNCPGYLMVGARKFSCWDTHNNQDLIQALAHSCDTFFYHTGLLLGAQNIHNYALKFGLAKTTNLELPYETGGFIPSPLWRRVNRFQNWYNGDTANLSIGQGDCLVTPLQIVNMVSIFANRGYLASPYIVKNIGGLDAAGQKKRLIPAAIRKTTIDAIRRGLREVVMGAKGTGHILAALPVEVAGKTGTAQVTRAQAHAWFAGFFPFENPKYAICVFLENGGSGYAACVVTKQIIEEMSRQGLL